jgi:hypothetical protein
MRWDVAAGVAVAVVVLGAGPVRGQAPPPGYSPYLNLARPGSPGVNYYALVRPQVEVRRDLQQLRQNTTTLQTGLSQLAGGDLTTGHAAGFMYFGGYYPALGRGNLPARTLPDTPSTTPPGRTPVPPPGGYRR